MIPLYDLIDKAHMYLLTEEEKEAFNTNPKIIAKFKKLDEMQKNIPNFDNISIGEWFPRWAIGMWNTDNSGVIKGITDFIENDEHLSDYFLIGFTAAWANSDIDHPVIVKLVKHALKNDLIKYPLNTTMTEYSALTKKAPSNRAKKDVIEILDMLMYYFQTTSIVGVSKSLGVDRSDVRKYLNRLVDGKNQDYKILIDKEDMYYETIRNLYDKWKIKKEIN
jgi:hypothetical protein